MAWQTPAGRPRTWKPCRCEKHFTSLAGGRLVALHPLAFVPLSLALMSSFLSLAALQKHLKSLAGYGEEHMLVKKAHALFEEAQAASGSS